MFEPAFGAGKGAFDDAERFTRRIQPAGADLRVLTRLRPKQECRNKLRRSDGVPLDERANRSRLRPDVVLDNRTSFQSFQTRVRRFDPDGRA